MSTPIDGTMQRLIAHVKGLDAAIQQIDGAQLSCSQALSRLAALEQERREFLVMIGRDVVDDAEFAQ